MSFSALDYGGYFNGNIARISGDFDFGKFENRIPIPEHVLTPFHLNSSNGFGDGFSVNGNVELSQVSKIMPDSINGGICYTTGSPNHTTTFCGTGGTMIRDFDYYPQVGFSGSFVFN